MPQSEAVPWPSRWQSGVVNTPVLRRISRADALSGIAAPAKLNLGLVVTGRRADGYHKLCTLMTTLALADTVRVAPAPSLSLVCDDAALGGDDNLVLRAARALQTATGCTDGAAITLTKRVPVAAGLGGGSSDAAAALLALDALWGTNVPDGVLLRIARSLGADVPFALYGGAAMAQGIGDLVWPVVPLPRTWLVLVVPHVDIPRKTAALYGALTPDDWEVSAGIRRQITTVQEHGTLDPDLLTNTFLPPLEQIAPAVAATRAAMAAVGARAFLSGSGPTLYALCRDEEETRARAARFAALPDVRAIPTHTA